MISGEIKVISEFPWVRLLLKSKFGDDPQSSAEMWIVFLKGGEGSFNLFWYVVFLCDLFVFSFVCLFVCLFVLFVISLFSKIEIAGVILKGNLNSKFQICPAAKHI